jgi:excisionase family DNA binding protein
MDNPSSPVAAHSVTEVIQRLGICRQRVYDLINEKKLVARKLGRRTIILDSDLRDFLQSLPKIGGGR